MRRKVKIVSTAKYLPKKVVHASELEAKMGVKAGWIEKKSGVKTRYFVDDETSPEMGAIVAREALNKAGLTFKDIDCLISTSGTQAQEIPCTASLIQEALGEVNSGVPSFDINSTCLSFVTGLDTISYLVDAGRYNRVLLVATEVASVGLNINEKESASLMGDGAAAVIIERTPEGEESEILASRMETYSSGAHSAEIRGGGSLLHPFRNPNAKEEDFYFNMQGPKVFKQAAKHLIPFTEKLFAPVDFGVKDVKLVIPHQASLLALQLSQKRLGLTDDKFYIYVQDHGNCIAASIPMGIHNAIEAGKIERGDTFAVMGTSAGFSIGGIVLKY